MENHGLAIEDAGVALELDKMFAKGYYRRAASYMAMGKYKKARCTAVVVVDGGQG